MRTEKDYIAVIMNKGQFLAQAYFLKAAVRTPFDGARVWQFLNEQLASKKKPKFLSDLQNYFFTLYTYY